LTSSKVREVDADDTDDFTLEVVRSYLISTVREMAEATKRTAYSTVVSEALDFTCGLFDGAGRMVAQAEGIPLHAGSLPGGMQAILETFSDFQPGDVYMVSDPYVAGLHQADVMIARPIFHDGRVFSFAVNRAHWLDIGGMAAGGWAGTATHVVQEGLRIPPIRIVIGGEVDEQLRAMILANVRLPVADWADFQSQVASTVIAERRIHALIAAYGDLVVEEGMRSALDYSRTRFRQALTRIPDGSWTGEEVFEDDGQGGGPHYVRVTLTKSGDGILADFSDSDSQVLAPINCSEGSTLSAVYTACLAVLDPETPLNAGLLDLVKVVTRPGTIVHPVFPAPCFFSTADPTNKVCEAVLKAFGMVVPERVIAGSYQTGNNVTGSGLKENGEPFQWFSFGSGGLGARATHDGDSAEWHLMSNCKNESMELWEHRFPLRFEEFALIPDSGGSGRYRGGLGVRKRFTLLARTLLNSIGDRQEIAPWGVNGGEPGRPNHYWVIPADGELTSLKDRYGLASNSKFANLPFQAGDQLVIDAGGGGGYGPAEERSQASIDLDVECGYVTDVGQSPAGAPHQ
jgi:N-methylhydantoinase B